MCSDKYDPGALSNYHVSLRDYNDLHFKMMSELTSLHFKLTKEKVEEARVSMEKRLDSMNEFRDTLKDQASKFVTRTELLAAVVATSTIISIIVSIVMRLVK